MRNLFDILTEKLHLNKDSKNYMYCDIPEFVKDEKQCPNWAKRKYVRGDVGKNKPWYAIYCYLYFEGQKTRKEVCHYFKDNFDLNIPSAIFQSMKENNLIYGVKRYTGREEVLHIKPVAEWEQQTRGWRYDLG